MTKHQGKVAGINKLATDRKSKEPHIIIGGCGRSGTTLLRVMLDTHPDILCGPETNLFTTYLLDLDWLTRAYNLKAKNVDVLAKRAADRTEFVDQFSMMARARVGKMVFAEKTASNVGNIDWVFEHWPNAKFIHVIRDGRDVVASLKEHPKAAPGVDPRPFPACVMRWVNDVNGGIKWRDDKRYMEVRYESLVTVPKAELVRVFQFIGKEYKPECLDYYKVERDTRFFPNNTAATLPVTSRRVGRWIDDLSHRELVHFWSEAGELMGELGYV